MYFFRSQMFRPTWLYDESVNGPVCYNEQIEEDADDAVWDASDKHRNVYFTLENLVMEAGDELVYDHEDAQWEMEYDIEDKWGFGEVARTF